MSPLIITLVLTFILLGLIIWLQFASSRNQTYFKIGAAAVLILFVWISKDHGKIYYAFLISILAVSVAIKEFLSIKKASNKSIE